MEERDGPTDDSQNSLVGYRTRIYCGYASIALTYVATILVIYCSCQPFHALWQINPNPGSKARVPAYGFVMDES